MQDVKFQLLLIFLLVSLISWGGFFMAARHGYHTAQKTGVMPNLHIKQRLGIEKRETVNFTALPNDSNS
ncbi:hypothetical protein [Rhizobium sp. C4]|uniref:hypothetical protein n=1 Tax=Rhizobium sp. C4 TaxID=1349800 RepID=UPI001E5B544A|nr:hypothetical protein [Rhizobium sp. C4]MCD2173495.1 hypothetical protein [Rhizobium sp. C4]